MAYIKGSNNERVCVHVLLQYSEDVAEVVGVFFRSEDVVKEAASRFSGATTDSFFGDTDFHVNGVLVGAIVKKEVTGFFPRSGSRPVFKEVLPVAAKSK